MALIWLVFASIAVIKNTVVGIWRPIAAILSPFEFFMERLMIIFCLNIAFGPTNPSKSLAIPQQNEFVEQYAQAKMAVPTELAEELSLSHDGSSSSNVGFENEIENNSASIEGEFITPWSISNKYTIQFKEWTKEINITRVWRETIVQTTLKWYHFLGNLRVFVYLNAFLVAFGVNDERNDEVSCFLA